MVEIDNAESDAFEVKLHRWLCRPEFRGSSKGDGVGEGTFAKTVC